MYMIVCRVVRKSGNTVIVYNTYIFAVGYSPRRTRWEGHVAHVSGEERCIQGFGGET